MGLAFTKCGRYRETITAFETSLKLGQGQFEKAKSPLKIARSNEAIKSAKGRGEATEELIVDNNIVDNIVAITS